MPEPFDETKEILYRTKSYAALAKTTPGDDFCLQVILISKPKVLSHVNLAPGADQALPFIRFLRDLPGEQYLDPALEKVAGCRVVRAHRLRFGPASAAVKAGWKDSRVIEHNQVIRPEEIGKVTKHAILQRS
jgi:hypothetical protein